MVANADLASLRHGGMNKLFAGVRAPTTLGTYLRSLKLEHLQQWTPPPPGS